MYCLITINTYLYLLLSSITLYLLLLALLRSLIKYSVFETETPSSGAAVNIEKVNRIYAWNINRWFTSNINVGSVCTVLILNSLHARNTVVLSSYLVLLHEIENSSNFLPILSKRVD